jgi:hypothetical protein
VKRLLHREKRKEQRVKGMAPQWNILQIPLGKHRAKGRAFRVALQLIKGIGDLNFNFLKIINVPRNQTQI